MKIGTENKGQYILITLIGRLDTSNYNELEEVLSKHFLDKKANIIVDCKDLDYVSSSGLRIFLYGLKQATMRNGFFHICCLQENIFEVFKISGFQSIFKIFSTLEDCLIQEKL